MKLFLLDMLASLLMGLSLLSFVSPMFFYWWIHGDYERYIWIISGPSPYDSFGGGPFQLYFFFSAPVIIGTACLVISIILRNKLRTDKTNAS